LGGLPKFIKVLSLVPLSIAWITTLAKKIIWLLPGEGRVGDAKLVK